MKRYRVTEEKLIYCIIILQTIINMVESSIYYKISPLLSWILGKTFLASRLFLVVIFMFFIAQSPKISIRQVITLLLYICLTIFSYIKASHWLLYDTFFVAVLWGDKLKYRKIIKIYMICLIVCGIGIMLADQVITEEVHTFYRDNGKIRYNLGFGHPNALGRVILVINMLLLLSIEQHNILLLQGVHCCSAIFVYLIPNSLTSTLCIIILMLCEIIGYKVYSIANKKVKIILFDGLVILGVLLVYYIIFNAYNFSDILGSISNSFYSRFTYGLYAIQNFKFTLFGIPNIPFVNEMAMATNNARYFVVDCLYVYMPLVFGIIPSLIFAYYYIKCINNCINNDNKYLLYCFVVMLFYSILESTMLSCMFNFMFLCSFAKVEHARKRRRVQSIRR